MDLKSLNNFIMPFDQFPIHWRFDDDSYNQLNQIHLDQIKPMTPQASNFLWNYSSEITKNLMEGKNFNCFRAINTEDETIKKWLFHTGLAFQKDIYVVWQPDIAVSTNWKIFVKFFDDFYYSCDEISIFDNSLNWGLYIHRNKVVFGSNIYDQHLI